VKSTQMEHAMLLKWLSIIPTALLCLLSLYACGDSTPVIIGFSGQLTGKLSDLGVYGRNGTVLAVEKINATGGINGRPLHLISKDDKNTPQGAIEADKELIEAGAVAIIGHMTSSQSLAALPFTSESGIILFSPTASTPQLTDRADSFFRAVMDNSDLSRELAEYAHSALDASKVIAISEIDNSSYSKPFAESFKRTFEQLGGNVADIIPYSSSNIKDWEEIVTTVAKHVPDAILLNCPAHDAIAIIQRVHAFNPDLIILSGAWAYTDELLKWGGEDVEDVIFVIDYAADNPTPEFIKFRESYRNRFGTTPNFASAFAYDATIALANGLKKTGGDKKGLADAMAPIGPIEGVIGPYELNEYGDVIRNIFIVTVQNGSFRTVEMR